MLAQPHTKYPGFRPVSLPDRQWPQQQLRQPPVWLSTDLRDGNQSLPEPMGVETKLEMFAELVRIGFKEIEVAFPAASQTDFDFVRRLITEQRIPHDVTIAVLVQSRPDLIERTFAALAGARRAIVHLYNPIAEAWRRIVFASSQDDVKALAVRGTTQIRALADAHPETEWVFEYSPETFSSAEIEFAKDVVDAVSAAWQPSPEAKMIVNLPATVEMSSPNHYADQIEWMHRNLQRRDTIVLSVHPHNDRGCAVAAAELAQLAGAERVEGCLFGHGERTGNVDLITLALNLYSQGIHPGLDFADIERVRSTVERCTGLPVAPRHPYAGELVFTAFSGSHQDAIKKGMAAQQPDAAWEVPYLPLDPADLGRSYEAIIRVNSQSGKGGVSFLLEQQHGYALPRGMQVEFSQRVQQHSDAHGNEVDGNTLLELFRSEYLAPTQPYRYTGHSLQTGPDGATLAAELQIGDAAQPLSGHGNGPLDALLQALNQHTGQRFELSDYHQHALGHGSDAQAAAYVALRDASGTTRWGAGQHRDITAAAICAVLSAANRLATA